MMFCVSLFFWFSRVFFVGFPSFFPPFFPSGFLKMFPLLVLDQVTLTWLTHEKTARGPLFRFFFFWGGGSAHKPRGNMEVKRQADGAFSFHVFPANLYQTGCTICWMIRAAILVPCLVFCEPVLILLL